MAGTAKKRRSTPDTAEVLYGFHPVMEALCAGRRRIYRLMVDGPTLSDRQARVVRMAERREIPWRVSTAQQLRAEAGSDQHQGVAAAVSPLPVDRLESALYMAGQNGRACLLVLLDSIVDPNNLGAIVRTAHCVGADALVVPKDRAVGATAAVSKASAGALEHTRLCRVVNLAVAIQWLKKQGVWVAGLAMEADRTLFQARLTGPLALVVGGEEKGLRPLVRQHCDYLISIPLCGRVDSLNASAAAAVVLYEAFRQRQTPT
ncbi:MAG: 23S rRNA (guanosine(2251)-2'-O)-methyltransferase RlmB [Desulfosarcina sp.]